MAANEGPASGIVTITPHDSNDIVECRALFIGVAGTLKINTASGQTVTIANASAGYHPLRVTRVWSTGTDADDIHALY